MKLETIDVTVHAHGQAIVNRLSIHLGQGELVGLIGPNGAGKSTLLKTVVGASKRSSGDILLGGTSIDRLSSIERARNIAYLPQERRMEWQLPARAVVMLGRFPYRRGFGPPAEECNVAVDRALAAVDAARFAKRPVTTLSGGERARVLLARALAVQAPLLLVDEPIAELDPYHRIHVMEILKEETQRGIGVMAVMHDLTLAARFMDRLILMDEGLVVDEGPPLAVLSERNLERVYRVSALDSDIRDASFVVPWQRM